MRMALLLAGAAALWLPAAAAHATAITQTVTFGPGPTDYKAATGTTGSGGSTFAFFNTALGTLNSITFGSSYGFTSTIQVTNSAQSNSTGYVWTQSGAQFGSSDTAVTGVLNALVNTLNDPVDGTVLAFGPTTLSPIAYDVRGTRTTYILAPGTTAFAASNGGSSAGGIIDQNVSDLSAFSRAGGGAFTPLFNTLTGLVLSNSGGNTNAVQTTTGTGTLTLVYNYTASLPVNVAEPASLVLLGAGLMGAGLFRRRTVVPGSAGRR